MHARSALTFLGLALGTVCFVSPAHAHISLEKGGTHLSRYGDSAVSIKAGPCGRTGGARGTHVYTYEPGQTITVKLVETIAHPGYFRIAFDDSGDDAFKEPASIKPVDSKRACPDGPGDHCGASDFNNNASVLMDNLDPHLASGTPTYTWQVKLPNVECQSCTLQVIQVMEDDQFHGPYDPTPGVGVEDIYHQCIDLVLQKGAGDGGLTEADAGVTDAGSIPEGDAATHGGDGGTGGGGGGGGAADGGSNDATPGGDGGGGCAIGGASGTELSLSALAIVLGFSVIRRRRSANR